MTLTQYLLRLKRPGRLRRPGEKQHVPKGKSFFAVFSNGWLITVKCVPRWRVGIQGKQVSTLDDSEKSTSLIYFPVIDAALGEIL